MRKIISAFLACIEICIVAFAPICTANADTGASLQFDSIDSAISGDRITVCLRAEDLPEVSVLQFTIAYDDSSLDHMAVTVGSMFEGLGAPTINQGIPGKIVLSWDTIGSALAGTGTLLKMELLADADESSQSSIDFDRTDEFIICDADYATIPVATTAGEISVVPQAVAESITIHSEAAWIPIGETMQFSAEVLPKEAKNRDVVWSVRLPDSGPGNAAIDQNGLLTPSEDGEVIIRAEAMGDGSVYAEKTITVFSPITQILVDESFLILSLNDIASLSVDVIPAKYSGIVEWESSSEDIVTVDKGTLAAKGVGTAYITAKVNLYGKEYSSCCRVDVVAGEFGEALLPSGTAHLTTSSVSSNIYSTNYASVDVIFDVEQNSAQFLSSQSFEAPENTGHVITNARFAAPTNARYPDVNDFFHIRVADDRALEIIPKTDVTDAAAIKALKSSYKATIILTADGLEYTTPETLTIRVDKKLPTVKGTSVKLNSFFEQVTEDLALTSKAGKTISLSIDESKTTSRTPACPDWLELNDDMTVSVKDGSQNVKKSGRLYLLAEVEGYIVPVPVTVSVSASPTKPAVKLAKTSVTLCLNSEDSAGADLSLVSTNRKVSFADHEITALRTATADDLAELSQREQTTYAASTGYSVADYNAETGAFTLSTDKTVAAKGKVLLIATVGGVESQTAAFPLTVSVYTRAPALKFSKSSLTLNTALTPETNLQSVTVIPTPVDYALDGLEVGVTDSRNQPVYAWEEVLSVERIGNVLNVSTTASTPANMTYKVNVKDEKMAKAAMLTVRTSCKVPTVRLSKTTATLNRALGVGGDWLTVTVTPSQSGYDISNLVVTVLDSRGRTEITEQNVLSFEQEGSALTIKSTENTAAGATYKVKVDLDGVAGSRPVMITVKTLSESRAANYAVSAVLTAKGYIDISKDGSGYVVITPKYKNCNAQSEHEETYTVTAVNTAVRPNSVTDATDCFEITKYTNGTVKIGVKDRTALDPTLKYSVSMSTEVGTGESAQAITTKPVGISIRMSTARITPSTRTVMLFRSDRYSDGIVQLMTPAGYAPIDRVEIYETATRPTCYDVTPTGNGEYAIGFRDDRITAVTKAGSLKLNIFLEGNSGMKPNATVNVSVKVILFK